MSGEATVWVLVGLGAFHGLNPGMGWLFAVALGLQERSRTAVLAALGPIAVGHAGAILIALTVLQALRAVVSPRTVALVTAAVLVGYGGWRLARQRHPRWVGMRIAPWELAWWSLLMASAHGAGLMLFPVLLAAAPDDAAHVPVGAVSLAAEGGRVAVGATAVHSVAMLAVMAAVALAVYEVVGVGVLRKAWMNLDLLWAGALVAAGVTAVFT